MFYVLILILLAIALGFGLYLTLRVDKQLDSTTRSQVDE